jgi:hypothetical protein
MNSSQTSRSSRRRGIGPNWVVPLRWHSSCSLCQQLRERKVSPSKEMATSR